MQLEKIINEAIIEWKTGQEFNIDVAVRVSTYMYVISDHFMKHYDLICEKGPLLNHFKNSTNKQLLYVHNMYVHICMYTHTHTHTL